MGKRWTDGQMHGFEYEYKLTDKWLDKQTDATPDLSPRRWNEEKIKRHGWIESHLKKPGLGGGVSEWSDK